MPKRFLAVVSAVLILFALKAYGVNTVVLAQTATPVKSIKFGSFTPPPTRTPTQTPVPPTNPAAIPSPTATEDDNQPPGSGTVPEITDLVSQIQKNCAGGIVSIPNVNCVDNLKLPPLVSAQTISELKLSTLYAGPGFLQCVGFVRASVVRKYAQHLNNGGNAIEYATRVPSNYRFVAISTGAKMATNDLAIWDYDTVGHIAYVLNAYPNHVFQVAEANFQKKGYAGVSYKTTDSPNFIGFLRRQ